MPVLDFIPECNRWLGRRFLRDGDRKSIIDRLRCDCCSIGVNSYTCHVQSHESKPLQSLTFVPHDKTALQTQGMKCQIQDRANRGQATAAGNLRRAPIFIFKSRRYSCKRRPESDHCPRLRDGNGTSPAIGCCACKKNGVEWVRMLNMRSILWRKNARAYECAAGRSRG